MLAYSLIFGCLFGLSGDSRRRIQFLATGWEQAPRRSSLPHWPHSTPQNPTPWPMCQSLGEQRLICPITVTKSQNVVCIPSDFCQEQKWYNKCRVVRCGGAAVGWQWCWDDAAAAAAAELAARAN